MSEIACAYCTSRQTQLLEPLHLTRICRTCALDYPRAYVAIHAYIEENQKQDGYQRNQGRGQVYRFSILAATTVRKARAVWRPKLKICRPDPTTPVTLRTVG
jgi:hypothetical protein